MLWKCETIGKCARPNVNCRYMRHSNVSAMAVGLGNARLCIILKDCRQPALSQSKAIACKAYCSLCYLLSGVQLCTSQEEAQMQPMDQG